jgi:hypothetical protein
MGTKDALVELDEALTRFEGIEKRIVDRQRPEKAKQGRERLALLRANLVEAKTQLGADPDEPDEPDPPSPAGWQTVPNKTFSGGEVERELSGPFKKRRYVNCTFQDWSGKTLLHGPLGSGIELHNCRFLRLKSDMALFFPGDSAATSRDNYGLKFINPYFEDCEGPDLFEVKCSDVELVNGRFVRCKGGYRGRHGENHRVINCKGLARVKLRCGPHTVVNCPDAEVVAYAGNLFGKKGEWEDDHDAGGGHNMQCCYAARIANVKRVALGFHFGEGDKKYPATDCVIAPGTPVDPILHRGTRYEPVAA